MAPGCIPRFWGLGSGSARFGGRLSDSSNSRWDRLPTFGCMKILVTGATGKVGSRLAKRLSQRGDQVRAFVRDPARAAELRDASIELVQGDLLDESSLA